MHLPTISLSRFFIAIFLFAIGSNGIQLACGQDAIPIDELLSIKQTLGYRVESPSGESTWQATESDSGTVINVPKQAEATLWLLPPVGKDHWNIQAFSYFRAEFDNEGEGLVTLEIRLDCTAQAQDWQDSAMSQAFALPGESSTLGLAYPVSRKYTGPEIFSSQSAKPNGQRGHWKRFLPDQVKRIRLKLRSDKSPISIRLKELGVGFAINGELTPQLESLPYVDAFGQVKNLSWPGKLLKEEELGSRLALERRLLATEPNPGELNSWGGMKAGPTLKATGYFRTEKYQGKWWFVDPSGHLFWSHGCDTIGYGGTTPIGKKRNALFEWLPEGDQSNDPDLFPRRRDTQHVSFPAINLKRKFGDDWKTEAADQIHRRFKRWGMNTLGAWSDGQLELDRKTPYAHVIHLWGPFLDEEKHFPNPYDPQFSKNTASAIRSFYESVGDDPWCLGIFLDNEVHWKSEIVPSVLAGGKKSAAKRAFIQLLQDRHKTIAALNDVWKTEFKTWEALADQREVLDKTKARTVDFDWLLKEYAREYYRICHDRLAETFPNHLYLGSRIHSCPWPVSHAAAEFVDVYSINHYWFTAGLGTMPQHVDKPFMVTEFHFGALDRGVPGPSLVPVHDQRQRARSYLKYVTSGLQHRQCVGTHWFAYLDQSPVGRPGENYNIGLVDVTDTPHETMTRALLTLSEELYSIRLNKTESLDSTLHRLIRAMPQ